MAGWAGFERTRCVCARLLLWYDAHTVWTAGASQPARTSRVSHPTIKPKSSGLLTRKAFGQRNFFHYSARTRDREAAPVRQSREEYKSACMVHALSAGFSL